MVRHVRIGSTDDVFQRIIFPRNDQVFQIDSSIKMILSVFHVHSSDIVILSRLADQLTHGLADAQILMDHDEIGSHLTTDFIIFIRLDHFDIVTGFFIHQANQFLLDQIIQFIQHINCVIGIHVRNDLRHLV